MGGDKGGSVDRRRTGGFRRRSDSGALTDVVDEGRKLGRGDDRNSSILSVSGTGSIFDRGYKLYSGTGFVTSNKSTYVVDGCLVPE